MQQKKSLLFGALLAMTQVTNLNAEPPSDVARVKDSDFRVFHSNSIGANSTPKIRISPLETPRKERANKITPAKSTKRLTSQGSFIYDTEVSWYGPGFYGKRTACGYALTTGIIGVAHRSLPCGTLVDFRYQGKVVRAKVIDRGPYVSGRIWDLSGGLCTALDHCFTGPIEYKIVR